MCLSHTALWGLTITSMFFLEEGTSWGKIISIKRRCPSLIWEFFLCKLKASLEACFLLRNSHISTDRLNNMTTKLKGT